MPVANGAYTTLANAPGTAGTSFVAEAGEGARFAPLTPPYKVSWWPDGETPHAGNMEIGTCTARATDTFTVTRATEDPSVARDAQIGWRFAATLTAEMWSAPTFDGPVNITGALTNPATPFKLSPVIETNLNNTFIVLTNTVLTPTVPLTTLWGSLFQLSLAGTEGVTTNTLTSFYGMYSSFVTQATYDADVTNVHLLHAPNPVHSGGGIVTNLYGFHSAINSGTARVTNAWQLYLAGTAPSFINGSLGVGAAPSTTGKLVVSGALTDPTTGVLVVNAGVSAGAASDGMAVVSSSSTVTPTAALGTLYGLQQWTLLSGTEGVTTNTIGTINNIASTLNTLAAYDPAITTINMFVANAPSLAGAGAVTNVYGYYSNINSPMTGVTNPRQMHLGGTAPSIIMGKLSVGIDLVQTANYLYVNRTSDGSDGLVSMAAFELSTTSAAGALDQGANIVVMRMKDLARGAVRAGEFELLRWDDTGTGTAVTIEAGIHNHRDLISHADNPSSFHNFYGTGGLLMYNVTSGEINSGTVQKANFGLMIRNNTGGIKHPIVVYGPLDRKILDMDEWGHLQTDHVDLIHGQIRHYEVPTSAAATLQTSLGVARTVTSAVAATNQKTARGETLRISATANNADASVIGPFTVTQTQADPILVTRVVIPTDLVNRRIFVGLFSAGPTMTSDTQNAISSLYFRYTAGTDTAWQCCCSNGSATTVASSGVTVAADTAYLLKIDATDFASLRYYINGQLVATLTTNVPAVATNLGIGHYLRSLSASGQKNLDLAWTGLYQ